MAVLNSGMFGRARGKTSGLVFAEARTKRGKKGTVRELVIPTNPNTPSQSSARSRFASAQKIVQAWGPEVYKNRFNRKKRQLTGFMSLKSIVMGIVGLNAPDASNGQIPGSGDEYLGSVEEIDVGPGSTTGVLYPPSGEQFPEGGRAVGLVAIAASGDWSDTENVWAFSAFATIDSGDVNGIGLEIPPPPDAPSFSASALAVVIFYVESPENSLRSSSTAGFAGGIRGEIQDMKIKR